jgi:hypothetical protein
MKKLTYPEKSSNVIKDLGRSLPASVAKKTPAGMLCTSIALVQYSTYFPLQGDKPLVRGKGKKKWATGGSTFSISRPMEALTNLCPQLTGP